MYVAGLLGRRRETVALAGAEGTQSAPAGGWHESSLRLGYLAITLGTVAHGAAIAFRGLAAGHWPTSNMFEFIMFLGFSTMLAYQVLHYLFRLPVVGALAAPLCMVLIGYAALFPAEVKPLVPALQSYWLYLHVSFVSLGEGFFLVGFVAAMLYLLRTYRQDESRLGVFALEGVFFGFITIIAFSILAGALRHTGQEWVFQISETQRTLYHLPPIIGPGNAPVGSAGSLFGLPLPLIQAPAWMKAKHFNTFIWSIPLGLALYAIIRKLLGRPVGAALARLTRGMNPDLLDEVSYRAHAIGYPIFTLGGLVFAMLWAKKAWGRYWFWDPKETWAFISFMVYTIYLHARLMLGWGGRRSAWIAVVGFGVLIFTLVGVNLLIVGLHSYAGGD